MLKGLACGAFKRVLAVFERVLAVLGKISTLWGRVHRMLTLKSAHTLHPAGEVGKYSSKGKVKPDY